LPFVYDEFAFENAVIPAIASGTQGIDACQTAKISELPIVNNPDQQQNAIKFACQHLHQMHKTTLLPFLLSSTIPSKTNILWQIATHQPNAYRILLAHTSRFTLLQLVITSHSHRNNHQQIQVG